MIAPPVTLLLSLIWGPVLMVTGRALGRGTNKVRSTMVLRYLVAHSLSLLPQTPRSPPPPPHLLHGGHTQPHGSRTNVRALGLEPRKGMGVGTGLRIGIINFITRAKALFWLLTLTVVGEVWASQLNTDHRPRITDLRRVNTQVDW